MDFLQQLGIEQENKGVSTGSEWIQSNGEKLPSFSPVDGKLIGTAVSADKAAYGKAMEKAIAAFNEWRMWPAPKRGEIVRQFGEALREKKESLGKLVSYEMGK